MHCAPVGGGFGGGGRIREAALARESVGRYTLAMKQVHRGKAGRLAAGLVLALGMSVGSLASAQQPAAEERIAPPVPSKPEEVGAVGSILVVAAGLAVLGLVIGATLIPPKRGHLD